MSEKRRDHKGRILRNGESQRADGKYMFRYTDSSGQRCTVYSWKLVSTDQIKGGQKNSRALRDMEKEILKDLDDQIETRKAENTTVDDLFHQFMDIRKDLREASRCNYECLYRKHVYPVLGDKTIDKVKPTHIYKLYQDMVNKSGLNPTTVQKIHVLIYQMFENAVEDHILRTNPASNVFRKFSKTVTISKPCRDPLTPAQQAIFIDYVYSSPKYKRLGNLFTVLLGTGMRISEALGLRWCDCDFKEGIIHVTHTLMYKESENGGYRYRVSAPKTEAGFRDIPMLNEVKAALKREIGKSRKAGNEFVVDGYKGFIFLNNSGRVYTQSYIYDAIQGITTSYNKEEYARAITEKRQPCYLPKISAHILRHTFCTRMYEVMHEKNLDFKMLQDIMGHRNIRTTMDVYTKVMKNNKIEAIQNLNGAFKIS